MYQTCSFRATISQKSNYLIRPYAISGFGWTYLYYYFFPVDDQNSLKSRNQHTSDPFSIHLVAKEMEGIGNMIIQTTSMLPRPRSESCFSTMESESASLLTSEKNSLFYAPVHKPINFVWPQP